MVRRVGTAYKRLTPRCKPAAAGRTAAHLLYLTYHELCAGLPCGHLLRYFSFGATRGHRVQAAHAKLTPRRNPERRAALPRAYSIWLITCCERVSRAVPYCVISALVRRVVWTYDARLDAPGLCLLGSTRPTRLVHVQSTRLTSHPQPASHMARISATAPAHGMVPTRHWDRSPFRKDDIVRVKRAKDINGVNYYNKIGTLTYPSGAGWWGCVGEER